MTKLCSSAKALGGSQGAGLSKSVDNPVSVRDRTDALVRGLLIIVEHHDAKQEVCCALREQVHNYLDNSTDESVWLKRCKYLLCYPLARYLKNELPPAPDVSFKPSGVLRGWMKARFNAFTDKNAHLWYSWFQTKRSTLPLSESIIDQTYDKHLETLTKPDEGDAATIESIMTNSDFLSVLNKVRREVAVEFALRSPFIIETPSTNSCFEGTRSQGGQQMKLREISGLFLENQVTELIPYEFHSMVYRPWVYSRHGKIFNFHQTRRCAYGLEEWSTLIECASKLDLSVPLNCTIQAVLEPNKVRVISKGNALPYYSCKPLQKVLHDSLRSMDPFRLIGRPLMATDIIDIAKDVPQTWEWFSVDYSAATDGLSWKYSGSIFKYVIQDLPSQVREIAMAVLGPHNLYYPSKERGVAPIMKGTMQNGQLMGSILSFPILCLANLGVYCHSMAGYIQDGATVPAPSNMSRRDILGHVLINGDDMVYAAPKERWTRHVEIGRKVGLEMSIGKAYIHREYLNINSQSVLFPLQRNKEGLRPRFINFLNTGLFFGQHKVQGKTETAGSHHEGPIGIAVNINTILDGCLPGKQNMFLAKILETHKDSLFQECRIRTRQGMNVCRNLFISEKLGGMGVVPPPNFKYKITKQQLYIANGFLEHVYTDIPYCVGDMGPSPGFPVKKAEDLVQCPWSMACSSDIDDRRVPFKEIRFKLLKKLCRQGITFYGPNSQCLIGRTERSSSSRIPSVWDPALDMES